MIIKFLPLLILILPVALFADEQDLEQLKSLDQLLQDEEAKLLADLNNNPAENLKIKNKNTKFKKDSIKASLDIGKSDKIKPISSKPNKNRYSIQSSIQDNQNKISQIDYDLSRLSSRADKVNQDISVAAKELRIVVEEKDNIVAQTLDLTELADESTSMEVETTVIYNHEPKYQLPRRDRLKLLGLKPLVAAEDNHELLPSVQLASSTVPLRSGPNNNFPTLFRGFRGDEIAINKRLEEWYLIEHKRSGVRGWIHTQDIIFTEPFPANQESTIYARGYTTLN